MLRHSIFELLLVTSLALAGCAGGSGSITASLGQEFSLSLGQSASIEGEDLRFRFIKVINDSRCPEGAVCIWAGEASCEIEITYSGVDNRKALVQPGNSGLSEARFNDYRISFDLKPYPEVGKEINQDDYRLHLTINKEPALSGGVLATFDVLDERYSIFITNNETIEQVFALQRGESQAGIPNGRLLRGEVSYNEPWSWHIDSEDIQMAEFTIELCDGTPSQVEADLDYWVDTVQRFCPWSAKLVNIEDFR